MKPSEKRLLIVFAIVFTVIVGGGLLTFGLRNYREIGSEIDTLQSRLVEMNGAIEQGEDWQRKADWLEEHVPSFGSRQEASAKLMETVTKEAETAGIKLASREFIEQVRQLGPDGLPLEDEGSTGFFDQASMKLTLTGVKEEAFFKWLHALQNPTNFMGVTRLQINPASQGKTVNVEVDITHYYRESQAPKLTKVN